MLYLNTDTTNYRDPDEDYELSQGLSEIDQVHRAVLESCTVPNVPRHRVRDELLRGFDHCPYPLHVRIPLRTTISDGYDYFLSSMYTSFALGHVDRKALLTDYLSSLNKDQELRSGFVHLGDDGVVNLQLGIRRVSSPSEKKIAQGLYYFQFNSDRWAGEYPKPHFYPQCIAPHVMHTNFNNPLDWALARMKIVNGYSAELIGRDYPPDFAEYAYTQMSALVCNPTPKCLLERREYRLSSHQKELFEKIQQNLEELSSPELVAFVLENAAHISPDELQHPDFRNFAVNLPKALENGLVIDRVSELVSALVENGEKEAVTHALRVTCDIYSQGEKPWWFKEDFSLVEACGLRRERPQDFKESECIAKYAGFAFEYAQELFRNCGPKILQYGLSPEVAIEFTCSVAKDYGIGNISRAKNVMEYAFSLMEEVAPHERVEALDMLRETLHRHKPNTEIIGILEGEEVNFAKPSMISMVVALLGEDYAIRKKLDDLTLSPSDVTQISARCSLPLSERARIRPALSSVTKPPQLITDQSNTGTLALPLSQVLQDSSPTKKPLSSWLSFDQKLHSECAHNPKKAAQIYFTFCALKMPDPLNPPDGFLSFLEKFDSIPDPRYRFPFLEHPNDRHAVSQENANHLARRYSIISNLLDLWVMGVVPWEELEETFSWLTENISDQEKKEIEITKCWDQRKARDYRAVEEDYEQQYSRTESDLSRDLDFHVGREVSEHESHLRLTRLELVERGLDAIIAVNSLVAASIFPARDVSLSFRDFLRKWRSGELNGFEFSIDINHDGPPLAFALNEIRRLEVIDLHKISEAACSLSSPSELCQLAGRITGLACAYFQIINEISNTLKISRRDFYNTNFDQTTQKEWGRIQERVAILFSDKEFIHPEALNNIIENFFWVTRYAVVRDKVNAYGEEVLDVQFPLDLSLNATIRSIYDSSRLMLLMGYFFQAGRVYQNHFLNESTTVKQSTPLLEGATPQVEPLQYTQGHPRAHTKSRNIDELEEALDELKSQDGGIREVIRRMRHETFGLLPVGGKIHVLHEIDETRLQLLMQILGLNSTSFRLIHANNSLILPPMPSSGELKFIAKVLDVEQIIDWDHPELQVATPGRLSPLDCAVSGATVLLSTEEGVAYNEAVFATTHDDITGYRIMVYDAGGRRLEFPFDTKIKGRTDILGRRHLGDIDTYQLINTILIHGQEGGSFRHLAEPYRNRLKSILEGYSLSSVLDASWILNGREGNIIRDAGKRHYIEAIKPCTDAWFECHRHYQNTGETGGVVAEVRNLLDFLKEQVKIVQARMLEDPKYEKERGLLLNSI